MLNSLRWDYRSPYCQSSWLGIDQVLLLGGLISTNVGDANDSTREAADAVVASSE